MPTIITHGLAAAALALYTPQPKTAKYLCLAAAFAMLPDADTIAFKFGIPYHHILGHRGITHSIVFAAILAFVAALIFAEDRPKKTFGNKNWWGVWLCFFVATVSHPLLDMLTNGGLGVALFAPFYNDRLFFGWRPVAVSPLGFDAFWQGRGLLVLKSEMWYIGLPALGLVVLFLIWKWRQNNYKSKLN